VPAGSSLPKLPIF